MTLLHVHFALRNQQAFQRLLDAASDRAAGIGSGGNSSSKSWGATVVAHAAEINGRDSLGRTVLHLACTSIDTLEYLRLLLRHSAIDVNVRDGESWTALHRALYHGNVTAAILLLERSDTDVTLRDSEGYTAFDLYNSTIEGTIPDPATRAELFTWGTNRNAALGLGDGDDRAHPEQVVIHHRDTTELSSIYARFLPLTIQQIQTSKLHTVVLTSEKKANVRVCGFGSGGRLGSGQHTQYSLTPLANLSHNITSVALGQDHTLALADSGEILSWGLNRFSQLGYPVETSTTGRIEEPVQISPKKIVGPLKKEFVVGVAASKTASACWTVSEVFTWGTNSGQLGYDKHAQPVQVLPRRVSKITKPALSLCLTDYALVCLLDSQEVICIWNDRSFKLNFPSHGFPHEIQPYRPPQAVKGAHISKVTCSGDTVACLSSNGEVFVFSVPPPPMDSENATSSAKGFTPQPAWTLKKQLSAAKDVAVGNEGTIIVCTESGHVFVRSKKGGISGKSMKYQVVPYIQRVVEVCANSTGAFGALRQEFPPKPILISGNSISQDLASVFPPIAVPVKENPSSSLKSPVLHNKDDQNDDDDDESDTHIADDLQRLLRFAHIINSFKPLEPGYPGKSSSPSRLPYGADIFVSVQSKLCFPAHRVILSCRSPPLDMLIHRGLSLQDDSSKVGLHIIHTGPLANIHFHHCQPMAVLILLDYLYSDRVLAIWDRRLSLPQFDSDQIKLDLQILARLLDLPALSKVLWAATKSTPEPTMVHAMTTLFMCAKHPDADVVLQFEDRDIHCHSVILRSRTVFFADFFNEEVWTEKRRDDDGVVWINMRHMKWHVMQYVMRFMCCGEGLEMFGVLDFTRTVDDVLDFMFDIIAAATELHLDRLVLVASSIILKFLNVFNGSFILSEATHFSAQALVHSVQEYLAVNLESLLESRMLDHLHPTVIKQFSKFVSQLQTDKSPTTRKNILGMASLEKHVEWVALQDFPSPIVPSTKQIRRRASMRLSPPSPSIKLRPPKPAKAPCSSPVVAPQHDNDDIFAMDDEDTLPPLQIERPDRSLPWKASSTPRVDMRAVMAETASVKVAIPRPINNDKRPVLSSRLPSGSGGSPWRSPATNCPVGVSAQYPALSVSPKILSTPPKAPISKTSSSPGSGLGPVFSPSRLMPSTLKSKPATPRSTSFSSQKAWTRTPIQPILPSPSGISMSFTEIQESQQVVPFKKEQRSLLEIQEEERAQLQEAEFMKWWAAEEERVRVETELLNAIIVSNTRGRGGGRERGRGRGARSKPSNP